MTNGKEATADYFDNGCVHGSEEDECRVCTPSVDAEEYAQTVKVEIEVRPDIAEWLDGVKAWLGSHDAALRYLRTLLPSTTK